VFDCYKKGEIASLKVQLRAAEKGIVVAVPTVEQRYDMILDDGRNLYKAQVKYAGTKQGSAVGVDLRKQTRNKGESKLYRVSEIDVLLVYIPAIDKICWLGPSFFHEKPTLWLRWGKAQTSNGRKATHVDDVMW
jgi:hypothetical protein